MNVHKPERSLRCKAVAVGEVRVAAACEKTSHAYRSPPTSRDGHSVLFDGVVNLNRASSRSYFDDTLVLPILYSLHAGKVNANAVLHAVRESRSAVAATPDAEGTLVTGDDLDDLGGILG